MDIPAVLTKAKIDLMTRSVFISSIALGVRYQITEDIPTAATNGIEIMLNPKFIESLTKDQLTGLLAHECWHIAFQHLSRIGNREAIQWNQAGDFVINQTLVDGGFQLPPGGLLDSQYKGLSTEQVYDKLNGVQLKSSMTDLVYSTANPQTTTDLIVRAATQSKMAGKAAGEIPGEVERIIEEITNPKLNWRVLLNRFLANRINTGYSWQRPNRRYMPTYYIPTQYSTTLGRIVFAIDTSGSMSTEELTSILTEIIGLRQEFNSKEFVIIDCDYTIHNVYTVTEDTDISSLKFTGGGGTSFKPVIEYCNKECPIALVYFSDLDCMFNFDTPEYPILWVSTTNAVAPIGETVRL